MGSENSNDNDQQEFETPNYKLLQWYSDNFFIFEVNLHGQDKILKDIQKL